MLTALAVFTILFFVGFIVDAALGFGSTSRLDQIRDEEPAEWPRVSIVVAARNEERNIAEGVGSLLSIDYPDLELVVVNDRSTDRTSEILHGLRAADARLQVVELAALPPGWLGKNYALSRGVDKATGELLLFTDADVIFERSVLRRAVLHMQQQRLDHLALAPSMITPTLPLAIFVSAFAFYFSLYARPWRARKPKSRAHIGIGAFNLVNAQLYRSFGGHEPIRMRPDDDMKLGKVIKKHGGRQDFLAAGDALKVEWYEDLPQAIEGLMKNAFSGIEYSVTLLIAATIFQVTLYCWPFAAILVLDGLPQLLNAIAAVTIVAVTSGVAWKAGFRWWYALFFPLTTLLFVYITWKASLRTLRDGGIRWRETFYSLEELRSNKV